MMKSLSLLCILSISASVAFAQNSSKEFRIITSKERQTLVLKKVIPQTPDSFRTDVSQGTITTIVNVNRAGVVEEVKFVTSMKRFEPFIRSALLNWKFKPLASNGVATPFRTIISFYVCWGGKIADEPISPCSL
jgi:hypothetical protein